MQRSWTFDISSQWCSRTVDMPAAAVNTPAAAVRTSHESPAAIGEAGTRIVLFSQQCLSRDARRFLKRSRLSALAIMLLFSFLQQLHRVLWPLVSGLLLDSFARQQYEGSCFHRFAEHSQTKTQPGKESWLCCTPGEASPQLAWCSSN